MQCEGGGIQRLWLYIICIYLRTFKIIQVLNIHVKEMTHLSKYPVPLNKCTLQLPSLEKMKLLLKIKN
jgi:hypothetical protein